MQAVNKLECILYNLMMHGTPQVVRTMAWNFPRTANVQQLNALRHQCPDQEDPAMYLLDVDQAVDACVRENDGPYFGDEHRARLEVRYHAYLDRNSISQHRRGASVVLTPFFDVAHINLSNLEVVLCLACVRACVPGLQDLRTVVLDCDPHCEGVRALRIICRDMVAQVLPAGNKHVRAL